MDIIRFITITPATLSLITRIDTFKSQWRSFTSTLPDNRITFLQKSNVIASIGASTRLSGSPLTNQDVHHLIENLSHHFFTSSHEQSVAGYFLAYTKTVTYPLTSVTEQTIKQLHEYLLRYSHKDQCHRGHYKQNFRETTAHNSTVHDLCTWYTTASKTAQETHPLIAIALVSALFYAHAPFHDGNGRLQRLLINLLLCDADYRFIAYCSLDTFFEQEKESYYQTLAAVTHELQKSSPDITPWVTFFLHALIFQIENLEKIIAREKLIAPPPSPHTLSILALLESYGRLSISQLTQLCAINRNTLKKYLRTMASRSLIIQHGTGRATWYTRW